MIEKRDEILEAALSLIVEDGVQNLTLQKIFARANTGSGTFYHYFENKEALVRALYDTCVAQEEQLLVKCKDLSLPLDVRLVSSIKEILEAYDKNSKAIGFVQWYCNNGTENAFASIKRVSPSIQILYNLTIEGQEKGLLSTEIPASVVARSARSAISNTYWHCKQNNITDYEEISKGLAERLFQFAS